MEKQNRWNQLTMSQRAELIGMAVKHGITGLKEIRNMYEEGGSISSPAETGMMKSKLAIASHFGNPTARRMTNYDGRSYTWPGEYDYIKGVGEPRRGNVYVGSYDNLVTPSIQDNGTNLELVDDVWSPENDQRSYMQSLKFNNESDARHFGEHYKEIAPMMNLYSHGGPMGNYYDGFGDFTNFLKKTYRTVKTNLSDLDKKVWGKKEPAKIVEKDWVYGSDGKEIKYRNREGEYHKYRVGPKRVRQNTSPTKEASTELEDMQAYYMSNEMHRYPHSNPEYDIPFIPEKSFIINNATTSSNVIDSLAKYTAIHNSNVQKAQNPSGLATPRKVDFSEIVGLMHEGVWGAQPLFDDGNLGKYTPRDYHNSNYFTAYGYLPAEYFVKNWHYKNTNVDTDIPPLLDAIRYYAEGDYNRGDKNHTMRTKAKGREYMDNETVKEWVKTNKNKSEYKEAFIK